MSLKDTLTNEELSKRFDNPFALVNHAISMARKKLEQEGELNSKSVTEILENIIDEKTCEQSETA